MEYNNMRKIQLDGKEYIVNVDDELIEHYLDGKGKLYGKFSVLCDRCGGSGDYSYNQRWGTTCMKCQGEKRLIDFKRILTIKEYEGRLRAKERRIQKELNLLEEKKRIAKARYETFLQENPITYVIIDKNSYNLKEELKANGYMWRGKHWVGYVKMNDIETVEMESAKTHRFNGIYWEFEGCHSEYYTSCIASYYESNRTNNYSIGDKINKPLTLKRVSSYKSNYGYYAYTYYYIFEDEQGINLIWKTSKRMDVEIDSILNVVGTVKEYKDDCVVLTRCKVGI